MSNWFAFEKINRQSAMPLSRRWLTIYYPAALILVIGGSWLVLFILGLNGIRPFYADKAVWEQRSSQFSPSVNYWMTDIESWAIELALDPILVATVMQIESCGNPNVISPAGAQGLFQVMPYHFAQGENMLDPQTNAHRGLTYLQESFTKSGGNIELTLAGYNGGHSQIERNKSLWPDETQRYVHWGMGIYQDARALDEQSDFLKAWLDAGGWQLCQQAEQSLNLK